MHPGIEELRKLLHSYPSSHALWKACEAASLKKFKFPEPLLDIGCGEGKFASVLFTNRLAVGLDISKNSLASAKRMYNHVVCADATRMPFRNEGFSTILSVCTLEHVPNVDVVFEECKRVLRGKGRIIFTTPSEKYIDLLFLSRVLRSSLLARAIFRSFLSHRESTSHFNSPEKWKEELRRIGFNDAQGFYFASPLTSLVHSLMWPIEEILNALHIPFILPGGLLFSVFKRFVGPGPLDQGSGVLMSARK